jgi:hypothetical protein
MPQQFAVESIVDARWTKSGREYRVRWQGFKAADDTWESAGQLEQEVPHAVRFFVTMQPGRTISSPAAAPRSNKRKGPSGAPRVAKHTMWLAAAEDEALRSLPTSDHRGLYSLMRRTFDTTPICDVASIIGGCACLVIKQEGKVVAGATCSVNDDGIGYLHFLAAEFHGQKHGTALMRGVAQYLHSQAVSSLMLDSQVQDTGLPRSRGGNNPPAFYEACGCVYDETRASKPSEPVPMVGYITAILSRCSGKGEQHLVSLLPSTSSAAEKTEAAPSTPPVLFHHARPARPPPAVAHVSGMGSPAVRHAVAERPTRAAPARDSRACACAASALSASTVAAPKRRIDSATKARSTARYQHRVSKYRGVTWNKNRLQGRGAWQAQIRDGVHVHWLGCFADELEAAQAYDATAVKLKGRSKAILNFPPTKPVAEKSIQASLPCLQQQEDSSNDGSSGEGCGLVGAERSGGVTPTEEMQAADSPPTLTLAHSDVVSSALYGERLQCVRKQRVYIEQPPPSPPASVAEADHRDLLESDAKRPLLWQPPARKKAKVS